MKTDERTKICLRELVAQHGATVYADAQRCEAFLRDLCPDSRREVSVLAGAVREKVPEDLLSSSRGEPIGILVGRLTQRLHDSLGLDQKIARWGVETWAHALGVVVTPAPVTPPARPAPRAGIAANPPHATPELAVSGANPRRRTTSHRAAAEPAAKHTRLPRKGHTALWTLSAAGLLAVLIVVAVATASRPLDSGRAWGEVRPLALAFYNASINGSVDEQMSFWQLPAEEYYDRPNRSEEQVRAEANYVSGLYDDREGRLLAIRPVSYDASRQRLVTEMRFEYAWRVRKDGQMKQGTDHVTIEWVRRSGTWKIVATHEEIE